MENIDQIILINGKNKISITINNQGKAVLKHTRDVNKVALSTFVANKKDWIMKKKTMVLDSIQRHKEIAEYKEISIFNDKYLLEKAKRNRVENGIIYYTTPKLLAETIKKIASEQFVQKMKEFSAMVDVKPLNCVMENARTRWGVCNSRKEVKINFRAVLLPYECFKYVAMHELCHLHHFNHLKNFWKEVEKHCPNYKNIKLQIKSYAFMLSMFR